jgi:hypothetical protein
VRIDLSFHIPLQGRALINESYSLVAVSEPRLMVSSWHAYQMNARSVDVHNGNPEILYSFQSISVPGYISEQYIHHRQSSAYMSDDRDAKTLGRPRGVFVPGFDCEGHVA